MSHKKPTFQIKGSVFTLSVLQLLSDDLESLAVQLKLLVEKNQGFFQQVPIIVDLQKATSFQELDFGKLHEILKEEGFIPVAIRGGSEEQCRKAALANWAILNRLTKIKSEEEVELTQNNQYISEIPTQSFAKIVTQPVRSGQQIYAKHQDLIVVSSVSPGAELIADGHIHVYGALKGRALAGVRGNKAARIFCQSLEAELISIAGHYWVNEEAKKPSSRKGTQIYLQEDHLCIVEL